MAYFDSNRLLQDGSHCLKLTQIVSELAQYDSFRLLVAQIVSKTIGTIYSLENDHCNEILIAFCPRKNSLFKKLSPKSSCCCHQNFLLPSHPKTTFNYLQLESKLASVTQTVQKWEQIKLQHPLKNHWITAYQHPTTILKTLYTQIDIVCSPDYVTHYLDLIKFSASKAWVLLIFRCRSHTSIKGYVR